MEKTNIFKNKYWYFAVFVLLAILTITLKFVLNGANSNFYLSNIEIEGYELKFSKSKTNYTIDVPREVESLLVSASPEDVNSKVEIIGSEDLSDAYNTIYIMVTAKNEETKVYTIVVKKKINAEENFLLGSYQSYETNESMVPAKLTLLSDSSYVFVINFCEGLGPKTGTYKKEDDKLILSPYENDSEQIDFIINEDNTLTLNSNVFACSPVAGQLFNKDSYDSITGIYRDNDNYILVIYSDSWYSLVEGTYGTAGIFTYEDEKLIIEKWTYSYEEEEEAKKTTVKFAKTKSGFTSKDKLFSENSVTKKRDFIKEL